MKALLFMAALLGPALAPAAAKIDFDGAADVSFANLAVPVGVRATGMGEAFTATGDGSDSLLWNPAGLTGIQGYELGFSHNEWVSALGMRQDLLSYGQALSGDRAVGLSLDYFSLGQLELRDGSGALNGSSSAMMFALVGGYARPLMADKRLKGGAALEYAQQSLYGSTQLGLAASLGLLYEFSPDYSAGLSLNHVGLGVQGFPPPSLARAGLAARFMERSLLVAVDYELPFQSAAALKAGAEYDVKQLALRCGWRQSLGGAEAALESGFSAGVGIKAGSFALDYSFTPYGELSNSHRVQATVELPRGFFSPRRVGPEGTTATAEGFYFEAQALEKNRETLKALIQYQRCLESYPEAMKKTPQAFYTAAAKKVEELQRDLNKGGDSLQLKKLTEESLAAAQKELKEGRHKEAMTVLKRAKQIDPNNLAIDTLMKEVRKGLDSRLVSLRDAAHFGVREGNLAMAVENFRRLLNLDDGDAEAASYMERHRKDIKELLQAEDRKAIYFFVGGKLEEAIKVWSDAEALDYFGDVDFKRNISKARNQMNQQQKP